MTKKHTNHTIYFAIIAVLVVVIVVLGTTLLYNIPPKTPTISIEKDIFTVDEAQQLTDDTVTTISEIRSLLININRTLTGTLV